MPALVTSASTASRVDHALGWLRAHSPSEPMLVVGATREAAIELVRRAVPAHFGWTALGVHGLASELGRGPLAARGLAPVSRLVLEAVAVRVLHEATDLGRLESVRDLPGLPRALVRTLEEASLAELDLADLPGELGTLGPAWRDVLARHGLADRTSLWAAAAGARHRLLGQPTLFLDVAVQWRAEAGLVANVLSSSPDAVITVPRGDSRTLALVRPLCDTEVALPPVGGSLGQIQSRLFGVPTPGGLPEHDDRVIVASAPGEDRECVEIARRILDEAEQGRPFDRIAVVLRAPGRYRDMLAEAFDRARIPAHFTQGTHRPDPTGRAFLALLACAAERLSATRFAEYLSLGQLPDAPGGVPPAARADTWTAPDDDGTSVLDRVEGLPAATPATLAESEPPPVTAGTLRTLRQWEDLLVDAAVIGGLDRWRRRLDGEAHKLRRAIGLSADDARQARHATTLAELEALRGFALPLLTDLAALPAAATWGVWLDALAALATRAVRDPSSVLATLEALRPMAPVGPVDLHQVRRVLAPRLADRPGPPTAPAGRVLVTTPDGMRGRDADLVFVPGLVKRSFPRQEPEDPLLRDDQRAEMAGLPGALDRASDERLRLRLAVGAARHQLVVSWSRADVVEQRPQVPSLYGLEVLRQVLGHLPDPGSIIRRPGDEGRLGWPAPADPDTAIDEAEYDLATLDRLGRFPTRGAARYLIETGPHLARALRTRYAQALPRWTRADGLVTGQRPGPDLDAALATHRIGARVYSATALQLYAVCPYQFLLRGMLRLQPREVPESIEEMDPLQRGTFVHEVLFTLLAGLRDDGALPLHAHLDTALARLDDVIAATDARMRDDLAPAIDRVWSDGIAALSAQLRHWLRLTAAHDRDWTPWRFELAFGLPNHTEGRDPHSVDAPVHLECGITLRGAIDLVERSADGHVRATDYKTGRNRLKDHNLVRGGRVLQPVLYALALEAMLGDPVQGARLAFVTKAGGFSEHKVRLDPAAREAAVAVAVAIEGAVATGELPASPDGHACRWCDFQGVCGPDVARRAGRKPPRDDLVAFRRRR